MSLPGNRQGMEEPGAGARAVQPGQGIGLRLRNYFARHAQVLIAATGQFWRAPVSTLLTVLVIGIALALPATLYVLLSNAQPATAGWGQEAAQISLYLKLDIDEARALRLAGRLGQRDDVGEARFISAERGLEQFKARSGFAEALDALKSNPLPGVLLLRPASADPAAAAALLDEVKKLPEVDIAQLDMQWLQRLNALVDLARHATLALALLLGGAVLLIVGNTIRLTLQNRRDEIEISKLLGATDAFVYRPFLYSGLLHGLLGGLLAWALVGALLAWIEGPAQTLIALYQSQFVLRGLDAAAVLVLLSGGALLGLGGAYVAVWRYLRDTDPR